MMIDAPSRGTSAELAAAIKAAHRVAIAGHTNPDGDAVGACLALALALRKMGKQPAVFLEPFAEKFNVCPEAVKGLFFSGDFEGYEPELVIALDCGALDRLGPFKALMGKTENTASIDHHQNSERFAKYCLVDEAASSACQVLYPLILEITGLDADIAANLYAGIVFDSGGFRHASTSPKTHLIAAELLKTGINGSYIYDQILVTHTMTEMRIFAVAIERMALDSETGIVTTFITQADMGSVGATKNDLDQIVNSAISLAGAKAAVFIYEKSPFVAKISFRSKDVDVGRVAEAFGGGGHRQAAGCDFSGTVSAAFAAVLPALRGEIERDG